MALQPLFWDCLTNVVEFEFISWRLRSLCVEQCVFRIFGSPFVSDLSEYAFGSEELEGIWKRCRAGSLSRFGRQEGERKLDDHEGG